MSQSASPPLVAVLNGPNMNMLGLRQPQLYGSATLDDVEQLCAETAEQLGLAIDFRQTNGEGELVSWVQECRGRAQGIVINPAGYTTTSIALMDALLATELPVIEVHVTNIHRREEFRQHSYVSKAAVGVICGLGVRGYALALTAMADLLLEERRMTRIPFDPDAIRALAAVLTETGLTEIEIAEKDSRIRVVRAAAAPPWSPPRRSRPLAAAAAAAAAVPAPDEASHPGAVLSPMVGIAYLSPEPGAPPFVTVGPGGRRRADAAADRGDEDVQPDQGAEGRHRRAHPGRQRHAGGIRRSPADPG